MNKLALNTFTVGGFLASVYFSALIPAVGVQNHRAAAATKFVQNPLRAGDGHSQVNKGHVDHKGHSGHNEGEGYENNSGHVHEAKGHDEHKDHSGHKEGDTHKDHSGRKEEDTHKEHPGHGDLSKDGKHSESQGKPETSSETAEAAADHVQKHDEDSSGHEDAVNLSPDQIREFDIRIDEAKRGDIPTTIVRPAEIKFNQDRVAHVVPRVSGVVRSVAAREGQVIEAGTVMATLDSRELADAKSAFLGATERVNLAEITHEREKRLFEKKIYSEKRYLDAKSALAEREIDLRAASQKLRALGFDKAFLEKLAASEDAKLTEYSLIAPFPGTVISRHITRGEAIGSNNEAFLLADVSQLWIDITIYQKDLPLIRAGQKIAIYLEDGIGPVTGEIDFVTPHLSETTRTAIARTNVINTKGRLRPGQFVKARIETGSTPASILVHKTAIQRVEESNVVFVSGEKGFSLRKVVLGHENGEFAEIVAGLVAGEKYVSSGAFTLKAQLAKESFGDGHNH